MMPRNGPELIFVHKSTKHAQNLAVECACPEKINPKKIGLNTFRCPINRDFPQKWRSPNGLQARTRFWNTSRNFYLSGPSGIAKFLLHYEKRLCHVLFRSGVWPTRKFNRRNSNYDAIPFRDHSTATPLIVKIIILLKPNLSSIKTTNNGNFPSALPPCYKERCFGIQCWRYRWGEGFWVRFVWHRSWFRLFFRSDVQNHSDSISNIDHTEVSIRNRMTKSLLLCI